MARNPDKILSASRRTDIPAFYMDWFMEHIQLGFFNLKNPYTKKIKKLDLAKEKVNTIVFWSKNYGPFIESEAGKKLKDFGFNLYFNFTINSESPVLENTLPSLKKRIEQLAQLTNAFGPKSISWRFDPICFYQTRPNGPMENNLYDFQTISRQVSDLGVERCVTSFCDLYAKIHKRAQLLSGKNKENPFFSTLIFSDPAKEKKLQVLKRMEKHLKKENIQLFLCCEQELFQELGKSSTIKENACIAGNQLKQLFGEDIETRRDYGQRSKQGCKCTKAFDVGSYEDHPCFHNCLFCYANPDIDSSIKTKKIQ